MQYSEDPYSRLVQYWITQHLNNGLFDEWISFEQF